MSFNQWRWSVHVNTGPLSAELYPVREPGYSVEPDCALLLDGKLYRRKPFCAFTREWTVYKPVQDLLATAKVLRLAGSGFVFRYLNGAAWLASD